MTVYFVSRHEGAHRWARILQKQGNWPYSIDAYVEHLDVQALRKGDVVIDTLPLREAAEVRRCGADYLSLDLKVPPHWRGQELTATQMAAYGATLTSYRLTVKETFDVHAVCKAPKVAKASPAVTVMLVSQELMPQYLGFVHAPTPHAMLVVTDSMKKRGEELKALLKVAPQPPEKVQRLHLKDNEGYASLLQQAGRGLAGQIAQRWRAEHHTESDRRHQTHVHGLCRSRAGSLAHA
jgi:CRISPR-associated protein Csx16